MSQNDNNKLHQNEKLLDHNYDGIQELDNMLPRWWLATFYLTVVFSVFYFGYYELGSGPSIDQEFRDDVESLEMKAASHGGKAAFPDQAKLDSALKSADLKTKGLSVFQGKCLSCHGEEGKGLIGPNLTDKFWIHGDGKAPSIAKVIYDGVADKGMPPWGSMLKEDEMYAVTAYVYTLKNKHIPGGKAPQGNLVEE